MAGLRTPIDSMRQRLRGEEGFTLLIALGVMVVTSLLTVAAFAAVQADTPLGQRDLTADRAYYAARAGVNKFLYELNQNTNYWQTCPTVGKTQVAPGATDEYYSYEPIATNGYASCTSNANPIATMIDQDSNATFRMRVIGYAGSASQEVQRGLVVSFRKDTPIDYLWYTKYETLDPATYPSYNPAAPNAFPQTCAKWERDGRDPNCKDINWISQDELKGPAYTQDQYLIEGSPTFGRANTNDKIYSSVPSTNPYSICSHWSAGDSPANAACEQANFVGTPAPNAPMVSAPETSTQLKVNATDFGVVYQGTTQITLSGNTASVINAAAGCTSAAPCSVPIGRVSAGRKPIIYVDDASSGCTYTYSPYNVTYSTTGGCGSVYVKGNYNQSLTIAAADDIIINGNVTKDPATPVPVLGLLANKFVRVKHQIDGRPADADAGQCVPNSNSNGTEAGGNGVGYFKDLKIDAAILALTHSFIVDNYDCGQASNLAKLHITGAIAQKFRGTVGTGGGSGAVTGYIKDYNYDDRYTVAQPPFLFNIIQSNWHISRETLCVPSGSAASTQC